jgi:polysaccharide pyruvyl transferase WcaK-like protein
LKIVIINVKYSPNLGDGAIAECLEMQLARALPGARVESVDIGGRDDFGSGGSIAGQRLALMQRVNSLPGFLQRPIRSNLVPIAVRMKYTKTWQERLRAADALIIGGGQLLMDVDNYFPHRIATAVRLAPRNVPIFIHAVGVSAQWSERGLALFRRALRHGDFRGAAVRDQQSQQSWLKNFGGAEPQLTRDPALLAQARYGDHAKRPADGVRATIALGVSDPADLHQHAEQAGEVVSGGFAFYLALIARLRELGFAVDLFTNGADHHYLEQLAARLDTLPDAARQRLRVLPRATRPAELAAQIAGADALIAHRLHANILAYAYGVPHVGLAWDTKLRSFFDSVGRGDCLVTAERADVDTVAAKLERTLAEGVDAAVRARVIAEAAAGIDRLAQSLAQLKAS